MRYGPALAGALAVAWVGSVILAPSALAAPANPLRPGHPSVQPWPVTITIRTVPPLAGVQLTFDGSVLTTGAGGTASRTEQHNFSPHTLRLARTHVNRPGRRYRFVRWAGQRDPNQAFLPTVQGLPMRANYTITAGFAVDCPVTPSFRYQQGGALDPARISAVTLRANTGQQQSLRPAGATWLQCEVPVYRDSKLSSRPVRYSVQTIMVGRTNVTSAGAQRFQPETNSRPALVGNFHDLTITAHDALFGGATGSQAIVTMPDLSVRRLPLSPAHSITLRNLPQGDYLVKVVAGGSHMSEQTVRLSRNVVVNLTAVTPADMTLLGGALIIGLAGLPMLSAQRRNRVLDHSRRLSTALSRRLRKRDASA